MYVIIKNNIYYKKLDSLKKEDDKLETTYKNLEVDFRQEKEER